MKSFLVLSSLFIVFLFLPSTNYQLFTVHANHKIGGADCNPAEPNGHCVQGYSCQPSQAIPSKYLCQPDVFGQIQPPEPLKKFIGSDPTGAGGLSRFFTNLVALFYALAVIVLIFMLLWGAWDWMTSEGDKEKLDSARKKLINAIIGILLFAAAFAIIQVLGTFTGFKFFVGQK